MRKYSIFIILLATLTLLAASCSKEKWSAQEEGTTAVTMSVNLPGFATKAYGLGQSATTLRYAVYLREDGSEDHKLVASGVKESAFTSLSATQSIDLAMGRTYDFVFWADSYTSESNSPYTFDAANKTVSIDYSKATAAGDAMDAFYGIKPGVTVSAGMNIEATLTRPFAQVNFGTTASDLSTAKNTYGNDLTTAVRMKAYTSFGLLSGEASGETTEEVTFAAVAPMETEAFPVNGYKYLAVAYALVNDAETKDVTYVILDGGVEKFSNKVVNVPLKKNYRTNIYGSLITSAANVTINISPNPGGDENEALDPWDGTTLSLPVLNETTNKYEVSNPSQLAGLAAYVNGVSTAATASLTKGDLGELDLNKPFVLTANIDLGGKEWTPIATGARDGSGAAEGSKAFTGTFDGCGNTIKGLKISAGAKDDAIGLFGVISGGTVKNLNLTDVDINVSANENAGAVAGLVLNGGTIEGVTVDGKVSAKRGNGGVVGRMTIEGTIKDCVNNATISGTGANVGGIVGAAYYTAEDKTMTIEGCTNNGVITSSSSVVGGICGLSSAVIKECSNTANVTGKGPCVGGIIGEQQNAGSITGCTNTANIVNNSEAGDAFGTGGIVGWIRYNGAESDYPSKNEIVVSGCKNEGSVTGGASAGGIVGHLYHLGTVKNNENYASSITATKFAAGVVGTEQTTESTHPGISDISIVVTDNLTSTAISNITTTSEKNKALFMYINDTTSEFITLENNTFIVTVSDATSFAEALATYESTSAISKCVINLKDGNYGEGPFVIKQYVGKNLIVNALNNGGPKFSRNSAGYVISVYGGSTYDSGSIVINGLDFELSLADTSVGIDLGSSDLNNSRYPNDVTIKNCTFSGPGKPIESKSGTQPKRINIEKCTANGCFALYQGYCQNLSVVSCVANTKRGINSYVGGLVVTDSQFNVEKYGIRVDAGPLTISGCTISTSAIPTVEEKNKKDVDAAIVLRYIASDATAVSVTNSTISAVENGFCFASTKDNTYAAVKIDGENLNPAVYTSFNFTTTNK